MATYADKLKIARIQLPSGTEYAVIDQDVREMIALPFSEVASYLAGDYVIDPTTDSLYRFTQNKAAGAWNPATVEAVKISTEFKRLAGLIAGGIHYRGKTTTSLYDGATTNPITINGAAYTAETGDLVILDLDPAFYSNYADLVGQAIAAGTYFYNESGNVVTFYHAFAAISAAENTSLAAIANKTNPVHGAPEFLFDGSQWSSLGSDMLGDLAYKDSATGAYVKPVGSGSVEIPTISATGKDLVTTTIRGVTGESVTASAASAGTAVSVAKVGTAVRYGTANVGEAVTYGNADVGTDIANVAISTETPKTFTVEGVTVTGPATAASDVLVFATSNTASITGITSVQTITPAASSIKTLTPAVAAPDSQTIVPAVDNGTITPYTFTNVTVPVMANATTTVATGAVENGNTLSVVSVGTTTAAVTVDTVADTITVD